MPVEFTDTFPPPSLDSSKWVALLTGGTGLDVGTPTDGAYPLLVDDDGDEVNVKSENKIYVSANQPFDSEIGYVDLYNEAVPTVDRTVYFGWRSNLKGGGVPLWGVDIAILVSAGPTYTFFKRVIEDGVGTITPLGAVPMGGVDGLFRVVRDGNDYQLYYDNGGWVLLDTVTLEHTGVGYLHFGVLGDSPAEEEEDAWIYQP